MIVHFSECAFEIIREKECVLNCICVHVIMSVRECSCTCARVFMCACETVKPREKMVKSVLLWMSVDT